MFVAEKGQGTMFATWHLYRVPAPTATPPRDNDYLRRVARLKRGKR